MQFQKRKMIPCSQIEIDVTNLTVFDLIVIKTKTSFKGLDYSKITLLKFFDQTFGLVAFIL